MKTITRRQSGHGSLLERAGSVAAITAAIALGVVHLVTSTTEEDCDEMDTTEFLLSGANRDAILAAVERDKQNQFVEHDLLEA